MECMWWPQDTLVHARGEEKCPRECNNMCQKSALRFIHPPSHLPIHKFTHPTTHPPTPSFTPSPYVHSALLGRYIFPP